jgi:hypothetical protein
MSHSDPDRISIPPGKPLPQPLRAAAVVIYATLALLALTIPRALVNWSRDLSPGPVQEHLLPAAREIDRLMRAAGIDRPYEWARANFLAATGKSED